MYVSPRDVSEAVLEGRNFHFRSKLWFFGYGYALFSFLVVPIIFMVLPARPGYGSTQNTMNGAFILGGIIGSVMFAYNIIHNLYNFRNYLTIDTSGLRFRDGFFELNIPWGIIFDVSSVVRTRYRSKGYIRDKQVLTTLTTSFKRIKTVINLGKYTSSDFLKTKYDMFTQESMSAIITFYWKYRAELGELTSSNLARESIKQTDRKPYAKEFNFNDFLNDTIQFENFYIKGIFDSGFKNSLEILHNNLSKSLISKNRKDIAENLMILGNLFDYQGNKKIASRYYFLSENVNSELEQEEREKMHELAREILGEELVVYDDLDILMEVDTGLQVGEVNSIGNFSSQVREMGAVLGKFSEEIGGKSAKMFNDLVQTGDIIQVVTKNTELMDKDNEATFDNPHYHNLIYKLQTSLTKCINSDDRRGMAQIFNELADVNQEIKLFDISKEFIKLSFTMYKIVGNTDKMVKQMIKFGLLANKLGDPGKSRQVLKKVIELGLEYSIPRRKEEALEHLNHLKNGFSKRKEEHEMRKESNIHRNNNKRVSVTTEKPFHESVLDDDILDNYFLIPEKNNMLFKRSISIKKGDNAFLDSLTTLQERFNEHLKSSNLREMADDLESIGNFYFNNGMDDFAKDYYQMRDNIHENL